MADIQARRKAAEDAIDSYWASRAEFSRKSGISETRLSRALDPDQVSERRLAPIEQAIQNLRNRNGTEGSGVFDAPWLGGYVGGGAAGEQHDEGQRVRIPAALARRMTGGELPGEAYWSRVRGNSMEPWLPDGSPILVEVLNDITSGRFVIYIDDEDGEIVKRIEPLGGGELLLLSDNPAHPGRHLRRIQNGDEDMYEDLERGTKLRLVVRGRVLYPPDTPQAILKTIIQGMAEMARKT